MKYMKKMENKTKNKMRKNEIKYEEGKIVAYNELQHLSFSELKFRKKIYKEKAK